MPKIIQCTALADVVIIGSWAVKDDGRITMLPKQAPIAAFTFGTTTEGLPEWLDTLSSGPSGVMV